MLNCIIKRKYGWQIKARTVFASFTDPNLYDQLYTLFEEIPSSECDRTESDDISHCSEGGTARTSQRMQHMITMFLMLAILMQVSQAIRLIQKLIYQVVMQFQRGREQHELLLWQRSLEKGLKHLQWQAITTPSLKIV